MFVVTSVSANSGIAIGGTSTCSPHATHGSTTAASDPRQFLSMQFLMAQLYHNCYVADHRLLFLRLHARHSIWRLSGIVWPSFRVTSLSAISR